MSRPILLREYDRSLLHEPCLCDSKDNCCVTDSSGHHRGCPRRRAYFLALQQAVAWKRMAKVIQAGLLPVED